MTETLISHLDQFEGNLWGFHFKVPENIALKFIEGKDRRIICRINQTESMSCALMPSQEGYFIMINKPLVKKLKISKGDAVNLEIKKDKSEYGMPVSEAFQYVILDDESVNEFFQELSPGKKRNLIHMVNAVKNPDIQIRRSMAIAEHLKNERGKLDFKKLNEVIKAYNQKNKLN